MINFNQVVPLLLCINHATHGFQIGNVGGPSTTTIQRSSTSLAVVPLPVELAGTIDWSLATIGGGVTVESLSLVAASAAAGVASGVVSQVPRIHQLQKDREGFEAQLKLTKDDLEQSKSELSGKIEKLEEALFQMDREFEGETISMKQNYETSLRDELQTLTNNLKSEFQQETTRLQEQHEKDMSFKLNLKEDEVRQNILEENLGLIKENTQTKRDELVSILEEQSRVSRLNRELEEALEASRKEIEALNKKSKWLF